MEPLHKKIEISGASLEGGPQSQELSASLTDLVTTAARLLEASQRLGRSE